MLASLASMFNVAASIVCPGIVSDILVTSMIKSDQEATSGEFRYASTCILERLVISWAVANRVDLKTFTCIP